MNNICECDKCSSLHIRGVCYTDSRRQSETELKQGLKQIQDCTSDMWACAMAEGLVKGFDFDTSFANALRYADEECPKRIEFLEAENSSLRERLESVTKERDGYKEALKIYADEANWIPASDYGKPIVFIKNLKSGLSSYKWAQKALEEKNES